MLGESWALVRSDPHNEVDAITPDHSLAQTHNFACSLSFCPCIPFCPNHRGPHQLWAFGCKRKETPPGSEGSRLLCLNLLKTLCVGPLISIISPNGR